MNGTYACFVFLLLLFHVILAGCWGAEWDAQNRSHHPHRPHGRFLSALPTEFSPECNSSIINITAKVDVFNTDLVEASVSPFSIISRTMWQFEADVVFGPITIFNMNQEYLEHFRNRLIFDLVYCLQPGTVVFVNSDWLKTFFLNWAHKINVPYILVSGGSDTSVPYELNLESHVPSSENYNNDNNNNVDKYNGDGSSSSSSSSKNNDANRGNTGSGMLHWYAQNCDGNPNPERFTCIPIGVNLDSIYHPDSSSSSSSHTPVSGVHHLLTFAQHLVTNQDSPNFRPLFNSKSVEYDVLVPAYNMGTHASRKIVWNMFCGQDNPPDSASVPSDTSSSQNANSDGGMGSAAQYGYLHRGEPLSQNITALCAARLSNHDMLKVTAHSKFVLSPPGEGPDCHRTYETLYLGSYPIVHSSSLDSMYSDLPVLIVSSWALITKELLDSAAYNFTHTKYSFDKLKPSYWNRILSGYGFERYEQTVKDPVAVTEKRLREFHISDGDLIQGSRNFLVYVIRNSTKCRVVTFEAMTRHGWEYNRAKKVSDATLSIIRDGPDIL